MIEKELYKYKEYIKYAKLLKNSEIIKYKFCVRPNYTNTIVYIYIFDDNNIYIISNNFEKADIIDLKIKNNNEEDNFKNTIIEGEIFNNIFYASDIILYKDNELEDYTIYERLSILKHDIKFENKYPCNPSITYTIKKYYFDNILENSKKLRRKKEVKALIYIDVKNNYKKCEILKWMKQITFNFKIYKLEIDDKKELWNLKCLDNNHYVNYKVNHIVDHNIGKNYKDGDIISFKYDKKNKLFQIVENTDTYLNVDIKNIIEEKLKYIDENKHVKI